WEARKIAPRGISSPKTAFRPQNDPIRKITGIFYHGTTTAQKGLLRSWLDWLIEIEKLKIYGSPTRLTLYLNAMFPQPDWEPLNELISYRNRNRLKFSSRLIGPGKQKIILV